jgi:hypothetical protein
VARILSSGGRALLWLRRFKLAHSAPPWVDFSSLLNRRFGPKIWNTGLVAIKNLRQIGSVDDYVENFLTVVCRCEGLTEAHQMELFVAGLHKSIRTDVKLMYLALLEDAMDHARAYRSTTHQMTVIPLWCPRETPVEAPGHLLQHSWLLRRRQWHC